MRDTAIGYLIRAAKKDKNVVLLTGDVGYGVVENFQNLFPQRFFNMGIAEQNMMAAAAGLAMEGKKVFVYSIGNFSSLRCLEQIRDDICYMGLDVNIISVGPGLEYSTLGFSHQATCDISCINALPRMRVYCPSSEEETRLVMKRVIRGGGPSYIRLCKRPASIDARPSLAPYKVFGLGDSALFACSDSVKDAMEIAWQIPGLCVFSCPSLSDIGPQIVRMGYKNIFTLEQHTPRGGLGGVFAELLAKNRGATQQFVTFGVEEAVFGLVGSREFLKKEYKIDKKTVAKTIKKILKH